MNQPAKTLTIAGSDSGGGAGIQADLKTFSALGCYGTSVITALTAQNTTGVKSISGVEPTFIKEQLSAVLEDIGADAIKIGMLHTPEVIQAVGETLAKYTEAPLVLDPVMVAKSGDRLLREEAIESLKTVLMPKATILTPNLPEGEVLLNKAIPYEAAMLTSVQELACLGPKAVLLKGGHIQGANSPDVFYDRDEPKPIRLDAARIDTCNTHGTGCALSSAMTAYLARGFDNAEAAQKAKGYLEQALKAGVEFEIGQGKGPVHHFFAWW